MLNDRLDYSLKYKLSSGVVYASDIDVSDQSGTQERGISAHLDVTYFWLKSASARQNRVLEGYVKDLNVPYPFLFPYVTKVQHRSSMDCSDFMQFHSEELMNVSMGIFWEHLRV